MSQLLLISLIISPAFCTPSIPALRSSSLTTILLFVCFVLSTIRVEGSTSPFISCSSKFTLLSAIALTKSIGVLCTTDCCPVWRYLFLILDLIQQLRQPSGKNLDFEEHEI